MTDSISRNFSRLGQSVHTDGTITTNASTASTWLTPRTITLSGDLTGNVSIDGSENVTLTATVAGNTVTLGVDTTGNYIAEIAAGTGITVTGSGSETATATIGIDGTVATLSGTQTLTNKTISGADNTLSNIGNGSLTNSSITINGVATSLGGTRTLVTDDVAEDGSPVNLWFTDARARGAVSITDSGGDGSLTYDSGTGVFTYTGPSATEVRAHFSAGTGVAISSGEISIGQAVATNSNVTFNDVTVSGNLTVSGTTTTINTETINLADNTIVLNSNEAGTPSQDGGIEIERGTSTNATLLWDEANDYWKAGLSGSEVPLVTTTGTQTLTNKTINASQLVDASVSNAKLTNSTISGKALGTNLDTLTMNVSGTGLSGSQTYNGSGAATFTVTSNATSANTGSTIVARDASGNFTAGTITAALSGNASTATSATSATTATNWGSYGAVPAAGTSFGTANTIGRSDANGYTFFYYINSNTSNSENPTVSQVIVTNGSDNYYRKASISHLTSAVQSNASGTWGINISGNAATVTNGLTTSNYSSYAIPVGGGINMSGSFGLNDSRLYLRTNGDTNHYLWNADDDYEELRAYTYSGFRVRSSGGEDLLIVYGAGNGGYSYSPYSFRAPIFYDSNDTGYYADPASTNRLNFVNSNNHYINAGYMLYSDPGGWTGEHNKIQWHSSHMYFQNMQNGYWIFRRSNGSEPFLLHADGWGQASGDWRAPIFYDSNNTGYYVNPDSTSYLYNLELAGGGYFRPRNWIQFDGGYGLYWPNNYGAHLYPNDGSTYTQIRISGVKNSYGGIWDAHSSVNIGMYDGSGNGGVYREGNSRWFFYHHVGNNCMGVGTSSTSSTYGVYVVKGGYFDGRVDGTIFYDANNTAYYCDPNGTARLSYVVANGGIRIDGNEDLYLDYNYGCSVVGVYTSTRYQGVFAMGTSYRLPKDGSSTGSLYGLAWSHPNAGGVAGNLNTHGLLAMENGSWLASLTGSTRSRDDMRAPIFYDNNNTGYYCDPNSVSQLSYVLANDWFRPQGSTGLYFQDYGYGLRSAHGEGNSYGNATTYGTGRNGWSGWGIGTRHVFMSTTGDNVGVHDNSRGWIWYWNGSNTTFEHGYTVLGGSARAPIFYDSNDTGYYCDPASTSYMYRTIFQGRMLFYGADQSADGSNDAQIYFTPGGGLTIASITTSFETGFVGSSYPQNRQVGAQATYDKRFYVWQDLVQYYSDERLKEKTGTLNGALDAIKSWTPFKYVDNALANSFNFGSGKTQIGLSAQEVEAFYPELVELAPFDVENDFSDETNPRRVSKSGENYLTLNYTRLVPILVQAIKEQQAKIEELENRINNS